MSGQFHIKRGDTSPNIQYQLFPADIDLTGATVRFQMGNAARATVVDQPATIDQATNPPIVSYLWQTGDTADTGVFHGEFKVTYDNGAIETFPNNGFIEVVISRDIV